MMIRLRNVGNRFGELIACIAITNPVPPSLVMVEGRRDMHMPKWGRERERETDWMRAWGISQSTCENFDRPELRVWSLGCSGWVGGCTGGVRGSDYCRSFATGIRVAARFLGRLTHLGQKRTELCVGPLSTWDWTKSVFIENSPASHVKWYLFFIST